MGEPRRDPYGSGAGQETAVATAAGDRRSAAPAVLLEEAAARPRGAMLATLLYLAVAVAAWVYMYVALLRAGHGPGL